DRGKLAVQEGKVVDPEAKKSFDFGHITKGKKLAKAIGQDVVTIPAKEWKLEGTSVPKVDGRSFVTGTHQYASDIIRPGMVFGKVLRPRAFKATLVSADTTAAEVLPNVKVIHNGTFIGVTAPTVQEAEKAIAAIKAEWKDGPKQPTSEEIFKYLKDH